MNTSKLKSNLLGISFAAAMAALPLAASAQLPSAGGLNSIASLSGGMGGLDGLGQITDIASTGTDALGVALPDFGFGLLDGGLATLSTLGADTLMAIVGGGGINAIPLLGGDISAFLTPEGLVSGLSALAADQELPIAIPVVGPHPLKLYAPVVLAIVSSQGVPVGDIPMPF